MAPLQQQPQEQKTSVQSKTMKLFSQSGLESLFKKTSFKVGGGQTEDSVDRIKVHGERKGVTKKTAAADEKKKFTGQPQLDYLLGTIIDYILRDFLHSWFCAVSEDKEFVDVRTKHSIEETVGNVCLRCGKEISSHHVPNTIIITFSSSGSSRHHGKPSSRRPS